MDIPKSLKGIRVAHISSRDRIDISKISTSTNPNKSPKKTNIPLQRIKYHLQLLSPFPFSFPIPKFPSIYGGLQERRSCPGVAP